MKSGTHLRTAVLLLFALLAISVQPSARGQSFTTFDPPGSQFASPVSINPAGQITGNYFDANFAQRGFLRDADGTITTFDAPNAFFGTSPNFITPQGLIVGTYVDANFNAHPFLRTKDGTITTFEIPSPGAALASGLVANSVGAITGVFTDSNGNPHGFLRAASGKFTLFDFPSAYVELSFFPGAPPVPPSILAMTAGETILGSYLDLNGTIHGFLRTIDGTFTSFDAPNAATGFFTGTSPTSINDSGIVTGLYFDTTMQTSGFPNLRVFLRASDGVFSSFDTPQLGTSLGTASINSSGAVAGNVVNFECPNFPFCNIVPISFLRTPNGSVSSVNDPKAAQGTFVQGINPAGEIFGTYFDENNVQHGFVRKP